MARPRDPASAHRQRGSMSVTMLLVMLGLVLMLGLVEIGYLYWAKRDAQKVADLAALAGAQRLELCTSAHTDNAAARLNAYDANRFSGSLSIACGRWSETHSTPDHFLAGAGTGISAEINAVRVIASRSAIPFFGQNAALPTVSAQAVARRAAPMAIFNVGSQLLRVNGDTPLGSVLKLVGADLDQTTLLGYDGLAQARITPSGLLQALGVPLAVDMGVAEFNALLAGRSVTLGRVLEATVQVLDQQGVIGVDLAALNNALVVDGVDLKQLQVQLGSTPSAPGNPGLFAQIIAPDSELGAALNTDINVFNLIGTSIQVANSSRAVALKQHLLGLVETQVAVVEPPSIGIGRAHQGPPGAAHNGARAYNAQVRVFLDIDTNRLALAGGLLAALNTRLHVPLHLDVTSAYADLKSLQCGTSPPTATLEVHSSVLRTCVGTVDPAQRFSRMDVCDASVQQAQMLTLLGAPIIRDTLALDALTDVQTLVVPAGQTRSTDPNRLPIGDTLATLTGRLMDLLANMLNPRQAGATTDATALAVAERVLQGTKKSTGFYDVDRAVAALRGDIAVDGIAKIGDWPLGSESSALKAFADVTEGRGGGLLDGLLNLLLGDLTAKTCRGLLTQLLDYNGCVKRNLASFLQTKPGGLEDPDSGTVVAAPGAELECRGILCSLLRVALMPLKGLLNGVGAAVSNLLASVLGLELGRTDVQVESIQCSGAQLVY